MKDKRNTYKALRQQVYRLGDYAIVPIRYEDRFLIMKWRNEQIYHLRQDGLLTEKDQEKYFMEVVRKLFEKAQPDQLLFSYLKKGKCIGYGGLVHIDWQQKKAELSFIMQTDLEEKYFDRHWINFIKLIEKVAFNELNFKGIFTYAYDLRPYLYSVLEKAGFKQKQRLKNEIIIDEKPVDVVIHRKSQPEILFRDIDKNDEKLLYDWANDPLVRQQSFNSQEIDYQTHQKWFARKLQDKNTLFWVAQKDEKPIGLVRFDIQNDYAVIGVSIDKNQRGKGYGSTILTQASQSFVNVFRLPIYAYIKQTNIASIRSFEKAGFILKKSEVINDVDSVLYIKKLQ